MRLLALVGATALLAGIDLVDALLAKRYSEGHRPLVLAAGVAMAIALFVVYSATLRYADLAVVTMGWIVLLQVGLLVLDWRMGLHLSLRQWAAVTVILLLQCYLITSTAVPQPTEHPSVSLVSQG